jgi:hypothetical protein
VAAKAEVDTGLSDTDPAVRDADTDAADTVLADAVAEARVAAAVVVLVDEAQAPVGSVPAPDAVVAMDVDPDAAVVLGPALSDLDLVAGAAPARALSDLALAVAPVSESDLALAVAPVSESELASALVLAGVPVSALESELELAGVPVSELESALVLVLALAGAPDEVAEALVVVPVSVSGLELVAPVADEVRAADESARGVVQVPDESVLELVGSALAVVRAAQVAVQAVVPDAAQEPEQVPVKACSDFLETAADGRHNPSTKSGLRRR